MVGAIAALVGVAALAFAMTGSQGLLASPGSRVALGIGGLFLVHPAPWADMTGTALVAAVVVVRRVIFSPSRRTHT